MNAPAIFQLQWNIALWHNCFKLKSILKGKEEYDELAFDLIRKPKEEPSLGGPCITEVASGQNNQENIETKKIITALGGENAVRKIPALQKRPLSRERMATFERLKSPIFQSGGNFISILIQDKETRERKIITVKKVKDEWLFRKFPLSYTSWGSNNSSTTWIRWLLDDGSIRERNFNGQTPAKQCETHIEFFEEVVGVSANKYKLATF